MACLQIESVLRKHGIQANLIGYGFGNGCVFAEASSEVLKTLLASEMPSKSWSVYIHGYREFSDPDEAKWPKLDPLNLYQPTWHGATLFQALRSKQIPIETNTEIRYLRRIYTGKDGKPHSGYDIRIPKDIGRPRIVQFLDEG